MTAISGAGSIKFGRAYQLSVKGQTTNHLIKFPLTCNFDITKQLYQTNNIAIFTLYGLSKDKRQDIYFDRTTVEQVYTPVEFRAGYNGQTLDAELRDYSTLPRIFIGGTTLAYTERNGQEIMTHIEASDGGHAQAVGEVNAPIPKGASFADIMRIGMDSLKVFGVSSGKIIVTKNLPPRSKEIAVMFGKTIDQMRKYANEKIAIFILDQVMYVLGEDDILDSPAGVITINSETGLIGTPRRYFREVNCSVVFEPRVTIGQLVKLEATLTPWVNGLYKVTGLHHHGTISGTSSGAAVTDLTMHLRDVVSK